MKTFKLSVLIIVLVVLLNIGGQVDGARRRSRFSRFRGSTYRSSGTSGSGSGDGTDGIIVGACVGGVALIVGIVLIIWCCIIKPKKQLAKVSKSPTSETPPAPAPAPPPQSYMEVTNDMDGKYGMDEKYGMDKKY